MEKRCLLHHFCPIFLKFHVSLCFFPQAGLMSMPGDSGQQARTACSYQHSPGAGSSSGHHHQHNHGQTSHHPHHSHVSPHSTHGQHQQHSGHSQQHSSLSHQQSHAVQACPTTGENRFTDKGHYSMCRIFGVAYWCTTSGKTWADFSNFLTGIE